MYGEAPFEDQEEFILVFMVVPDELTLDLRQFDMLTIQLRHDLGIPVFSDLGKF
jgi:hypothetical protein